MKKNVAGQAVGSQMVSAADGSPFTAAVTVYVTGDAGTQAIGSVGSGVCAHKGFGYHTYLPSIAETNSNLVAFTFVGSGAVPATVQIYTGTPQTADNTANVAAIKAKTDSLVFTVPGVVDANALRVGGTVQTGRDLGASVLLSSGAGTGQILLSSGTVTTGTVSDKSGYSINLAQTGLVPRDLGAVADTAITVGDCLVGAVSGAAGKETVAGTTYTVKTPSTGTTIRVFTLDSATAPTSRS